MDIVGTYRIAPAVLPGLDSMHARKTHRDWPVTSRNPPVKQCIRPQWLGHLQRYLKAAFIVGNQMFGPNAELHLTVPDFRLTYDLFPKHDLAAGDAGIKHVHGGTADELCREKRSGRFIDLQGVPICSATPSFITIIRSAIVIAST